MASTSKIPSGAVSKEWNIPTKGEFRFEVPIGETVGLTLKSGLAEIYGTELAGGREYELTGAKMAVFTYTGATVSVRGSCEVEYVSEETATVPLYLNVHAALEGLRQKAAEGGDEGPRVLVVGSSRHTVSTILTNYAIRSGKTPTLVDLDPSRGMLMIPGALTAQTVERVWEVEEASFPETSVSPRLSYYYGHQSPSDNRKLYNKMAARLAFAVNSRLASLDDSGKSGAIIIAPADISGENLQELREMFRVGVVLVIGNERLYSTIAKGMVEGVTVLKVPLSGGVVQLDSAYRRSLAQRQFNSYFYGGRHEFTPFSLVLPFAEVNLRRLGESALAPSSALPLGATRKVTETRTTRVEPTKALLLYSILGVSSATEDEEEQLSESGCVGYVYVTGVDEVKKQLTLLSPCPGKLPRASLLPFPSLHSMSLAMDLLVREKQGLSRVEYGLEGERRSGVQRVYEKAPHRCQYNQIDGRILAFTTPTHVILQTVNGDGTGLGETTELCRVELDEVLDFSLSPTGRHLVTFCSPPSGNLTTGEAAPNTPNLHVWRVPERAGQNVQLLASFLHRKQNDWEVQWTSDETFFARLVQNEVRFHRADDASKVAFKIQQDNLSAFKLSPGAYPKVAIFIREAKGEPAAIKIFLLPSDQKPIASKFFFKADRIEFTWSPTGKHLLALTHTDVDSTGQSYYGENNLYFMSGDGSFDCRVPLDKAGPVHDISWGPRGDEFISCYGYMPSKVTLFNLRCEPAFQFPVESKNHVRYSPAGNLICFGGFGNLAGYVEIWTRSGTTLRRVGQFQATGASICEWSPSGHCLVTATVTPRLRVDNGYKIWSWTGNLLETAPFQELYQVTWRPRPADLKFPLVDFSKSSPINKADKTNADLPPVKAAYVPPALRNRPTSSPGLKSSKPAPAAVAVQVATINSGLTNREKNIRKLQKKLDQIRELKARLDDGLQLELNQLEKIKSEAEVEKELNAVMAQPDV